MFLFFFQGEGTKVSSLFYFGTVFVILYRKKVRDMARDIFTMLTRGNDGRLSVNNFETLEKANETLEMYIEAQKYIEGQFGTVDVDYHSGERLSIPGFVFRSDDIISHVTTIIRYDSDETRTDRYILKTKLY